MTGRERVVVVGVDGTAASVAALRHALAYAQGDAAEVEVVTAWSGLDLSRESRHAARRAALRAQTAVVARARRQVDVDVHVSAVLVEGHPHQVLVDAARGADRLVLGAPTLHPGPLHHVCLRGATCPVVLVPADDPFVVRPAS